MSLSSGLKIRCPKCKLPAEAVLEEAAYKCIMYVCPRCKSNVVCYDNKVDVITDKCLQKLLKKKKLQYCGSISFDKKFSRKKKNVKHNREDKVISGDDILNLRILLETEDNFDKIISQL